MIKIGLDNKSAMEYAQEFRKHVDAGEYIGLTDSIIIPWLNDYPDDANVFYALVIMGAVTNNSIEELGAVLEEAEARRPLWEDGADWFKNSAAMTILKKSGRL